jgi:hypothetical protein
MEQLQRVRGGAVLVKKFCAGRQGPLQRRDIGANHGPSARRWIRERFDMPPPEYRLEIGIESILRGNPPGFMDKSEEFSPTKYLGKLQEQPALRQVNAGPLFYNEITRPGHSLRGFSLTQKRRRL